MSGVFPHFVVEIDHPQGIKNSSSNIFPCNTENLEDDCNIIKYSFVEEKAEVLENNTHSSPKAIYFVVGNSQDVSSIYDYLTLSREDFSKNNFEKCSFS